MELINHNMTTNQLLPGFWSKTLIVLLVALSLSGIANHELWTPDEPREAAIALSMSRSGNFVIPELAGKAFVEKPPLFYIIASFFLLGFGQIIGNTAALRLISACFGLGTLLFTYQLGKIYFDRPKALLASVMLATMLGFIHVTHWLLVDNALTFFIVASIWALAKTYPDLTEPARLCPPAQARPGSRPARLPETTRVGQGARPGSRDGRLLYLPLAGFFVAGVFLTKGFIGPIIIFFAWLGLFIPWIYKCRGRAWILTIHLLSLGIALSISAVWIIAFAMKGGPELFHEWWWMNHFGRFTGQSTNLGHLAPWYYYFTILPIYVLPWIVPFIINLFLLFKKRLRSASFPAGGAMIILWIIGGFFVLSLSATKRDIYLSVLMPACALLSVCDPDQTLSKLSRYFYIIWLFLLLSALAFIIAAPLIFPCLSLNFGWQQILAIAVVAISLIIFSGTKTAFLNRFLIVTVICYATLLTIVCPAIDQIKNYRPDFEAMTSVIKSHPDIKAAGYDLDETTLAGFYYYCDLEIPSIPDRQTMNKILQGQHQQYNAVLSLKKNGAEIDLSDKPNQVIFETHMGKRRLLQLLAAPDYKHRRQTIDVRP